MFRKRLAVYFQHCATQRAYVPEPSFDCLAWKVNACRSEGRLPISSLDPQYLRAGQHFPIR